ncbi:hypothetical protein M9H77_27647 [Catharanthus roseus]|uniref:Uncharacterized protein n=1 Tax=Catharanthus roseus TaxID=4058 RepID=A0ACC0ADG8_CATRO|nr:hypothetical protein M9H77_27647 [Catharanthus roseus]
MAFQNRMRYSKNELPNLLQSKAPAKKIKKPNEGGKNRTFDFCHNRQNWTTNTQNLTSVFKTGRPTQKNQKSDFSSHNNNLISHFRFSSSQATQAHSQPRMVTNSGSNKRIHR